MLYLKLTPYCVPPTCPSKKLQVDSERKDMSTSTKLKPYFGLDIIDPRFSVFFIVVSDMRQVSSSSSSEDNINRGADRQ